MATLLTRVVGGVAGIRIAAALSVADFGSYSFATSLVSFVVLFFEFGLFFPAGRRLAVDSKRYPLRETAGSALALAGPVCFLFGATIFGLSFAIDALFHVQAGHALRVTVGFAALAPLQFVALQLATGSGRLLVVGAGNLVASVAILLSVSIEATLLGDRLTVQATLLIVIGSMGLSGLAQILCFRPAMRNIRWHVSESFRDAKRYGLNVYVGRVASIATYNMDVLMVGAFASGSAVGLYNLAGVAGQLIGMPATSMASALFPKLAREKFVAKNVLAASWAVGLVLTMAALIVGRTAIASLLGRRYLASYSMLLPMGLAGCVRGVTTIYNVYLSAHGRGKDLQRAGFILTGSNLALNFAFIPIWGGIGAAWASFLALVFNLFAHMRSYGRIVGES